MKLPFTKSSGEAQSPVSLLAAQVLVALVPAVCVLWFMTAAMRNERLAVQTRFTEVYAQHLTSLQRQAAGWIKERQAAFQAAAGGTAPETFAAVVRDRLADSALIYDRTSRLLYPTPAAVVPVSAEADADWTRARELEFQRRDFAGAAEVYGRIAEASRNDHLRARAMLAQAVCWLQTNEKERALARLAELAGDASLRHAVSAQGMLLAPDAQLLILKTLGTEVGPDLRAGLGSSSSRELNPGPLGERAPPLHRQRTLADLIARLNDYANADLPANQRRFLMAQLRALAPETITFPTQEAEELAAVFLENDPAPPKDLTPAFAEPTVGRLQRTPLAQVWRLPSADGTVVALFREERLRTELAAWLEQLALPDVRVRVLPPNESFAPKGPVAPQDAGESFPGWRLGLSFKDGDPLAETVARQARFYLGVGVLVVGVIVLLSWLVARYVVAQIQLARLKDELVSTVSHELKTPLASMRVLVDTLSAGRYRDEAQMQRYLQLTAKEHLRLSHLIENFLVFSRLARRQQQFHFTALAPQDVVRAALDALGDKLTAPPCHLTTRIAPDLPAIPGDADALATVLVNLLDNAYKYTDGEKHIEVSAHAEGNQVVFAVTDNGIGIPPEEQRRIFDRFHQVDQSLTRQRGGCGLGLSIVHSIVEAHHGTVEVKSAPGRGSTFRVRIPVETRNVERSTLNV